MGAQGEEPGNKLNDELKSTKRHVICQIRARVALQTSGYLNNGDADSLV